MRKVSEALDGDALALQEFRLGDFRRHQQRMTDVVTQGGDHHKIRHWRLKQALGRTWLRRPELLERLELDKEQQVLLEEFKTEFKAKH